MDFGKAFSFPFSDPDWLKKIAIMALVSLIPIIGQMVLLGWALQITKRVINDELFALPELNFGDQLSSGFKVLIISFVFSLPIILLSIPLQAVGPAGAALEFDEDTLVILMTVVSLCCGGLMLFYSLFMAFLIPAAVGTFAASGELGSAFKIGDLIGLVRAAPVAYLLVVLGGMIAGFISGLGIIACGIGVFLTMVYAQSITGHLIGQAYKTAKASKI